VLHVVTIPGLSWQKGKKYTEHIKAFEVFVELTSEMFCFSIFWKQRVGDVPVQI
jgi:hypothetical protein